jgi:hypothetical protein
MGPQNGPPSWGKTPSELTGPTAFTVVSEAARERQTPIYGSVEALSTATLHRSPPRGPPPRQVPASRPLAIPNGAPVRWQGGRNARMNETLAPPISFRRRCRRSPKEIQCVRDATHLFGARARSLRRLDDRWLSITIASRGEAASDRTRPPAGENSGCRGHTRVSKRPSKPWLRRMTLEGVVKRWKS